MSTTPESPVPGSVPAGSARITSIDALRGLVMFTMIFVNDLAGVSDRLVPAGMKHFHGKSGMTFVDLVFPAFLFIVGMSIPFGLGSRLRKGEPLGKVMLHVAVRTLSLLFIGILMVNETPSSEKMGWSGALWATLMYLAAILAFCSIIPPQQAAAAGNRQRTLRMISLGMRLFGLATLVFLAFAFRGEDGHRIFSLTPFSIHTEWYGILGLIGWAYLVGAMVFLILRGHRTGLLGCAVLLMCLYPADQHGAFNGFWLAHYVDIGATLGSQAAIAVAGLLLASVLVAPDTGTVWSRTRFTLLFIAGCAAAAWLLHGLYGINKNRATPSWCLWACAITAALWLLFYFLSDVSPFGSIARPFAVAGQNVFLAYLLSEMLPSAIDLLHLGSWYGGLAEHSLAHAVARSAGCAVVILCLTAALNRLGFRLKL
jgi:heparan-alpha-glucosaminide N-acetyltransferase